MWRALEKKRKGGALGDLGPWGPVAARGTVTCGRAGWKRRAVIGCGFELSAEAPPTSSSAGSGPAVDSSEWQRGRSLDLLTSSRVGGNSCCQARLHLGAAHST